MAEGEYTGPVILEQAVKGDISYSKWSDGKISAVRRIYDSKGIVSMMPLPNPKTDFAAPDLNWVKTGKEIKRKS